MANSYGDIARLRVSAVDILELLQLEKGTGSAGWVQAFPGLLLSGLSPTLLKSCCLFSVAVGSTLQLFGKGTADIEGLIVLCHETILHII